jgi:hypothetical protein
MEEELELELADEVDAAGECMSLRLKAGRRGD